MKKLYVILFILFVCLSSIVYAQIETSQKQYNGADIQQVRLEKAEAKSDQLSSDNEHHRVFAAELTTPDTIIQVTQTEQRTYLKGYEAGYNRDSDGSMSGAKAAPANDDICDALSLPLDGGCLYNNTNVQSSSDYFGGCIPNGATSVFYEFTPTGTNNMITITLSGFSDLGRQLYFMLLEEPCTAPSIISVYCTNTPYSSGGTVEQSFYNLVAGTTYYVMIATQPGGGNQVSSYDICGEEMIAPPLITGPEQDCLGAIPVCDFEYTQANSYTGIGSIDDIIDATTCLVGGESNSVWYVFTPQTSGDMAFEITTTMDYDWALFDLTDIGGCSNIPGATPVLCNYSGTNGNTGTTLPINATTPRSVDHLGSPLMPGIPVVAGNTYALLINNYSADANGYTLTFDITAGTASIADNPPTTGAFPTMSSATASCTSNEIEVTLSEFIECLSIGQGGFTLTNTTNSTDFTSAMTAFYGGNCATSELTTSLMISHDGTLTTGQYELEVVNPNTISDKCGNLIPIGGTVTFNYLAPLSLTASESSICTGESVNLDADGADGTPSVVTYSLNPGGLTNTTNGVFSGLTPAITTTYTVSATYGGCTRTANLTVDVEGNIIVSVDPASKTVCNFSSPITLTATTTINGSSCGACTYSWSTAETTSSIDVSAAGSYSVSSVTPGGCASFNTATSIISLATSGGGGSSCDVIYVSPAGGGDGYSKSEPTTLDDAVTKARCTNTVIKMRVGVYTLNDYQTVPSYITIEGGYDSNFETKSSDMTGGSNSTTIRRSAGEDSGSGNENDCSAFRVEDGAEGFRIQNLRIEMPGSPSVAANVAGSGLKNYGIKLGTSCSDYNIVRCYIDAGVGATP